MRDGTSVHIEPDLIRIPRGGAVHVPIQVVDSLTHAVLSSRYLTREENVALLDSEGYMAINQ